MKTWAYWAGWIAVGLACRFLMVGPILRTLDDIGDRIVMAKSVNGSARPAKTAADVAPAADAAKTPPLEPGVRLSQDKLRDMLGAQALAVLQLQSMIEALTQANERVQQDPGASRAEAAGYKIELDALRGSRVASR